VLVLLDEHLPRKLGAELTGHDVRTVRQMGWSTLRNGALLRAAVAQGVRAMLTMDRNVPQQQNLSQIGIGLVILRARDSRLVTLRLLVPAALAALATLVPGAAIEVGDRT
jgi:hypothetical protein